MEELQRIKDVIEKYEYCATQHLNNLIQPIESSVATLQAENEKLWKLLEEQVKQSNHQACRFYEEGCDCESAWAAFQKANDLTQNKK